MKTINEFIAALQERFGEPKNNPAQTFGDIARIFKNTPVKNLAPALDHLVARHNPRFGFPSPADISKSFESVQERQGKNQQTTELPMVLKNSPEWKAWRSWRQEHGLGVGFMESIPEYTVPQTWPTGYSINQYDALMASYGVGKKRRQT